MTAQETNLLNAFETTLTGTIGASDLTITVNSVVDSASNTLAAPCYLVLNPDSATNREVVLVSSINVGTKTLTISAIGNRYLTGSAANSGLSHASGSVVRMSPLQQHIEDLNDRVDELPTNSSTDTLTNKTIDADNNTISNLEVDNLKSGVLDTDLSSTAGTDTTLPSAKAVKTYVDAQTTAQDLDATADSGGPISIDLDSETLDIAGGTGIDTTASGNEISIAIDSTVVTESSTDTLTNKSINLANNTLTSTLAQLNTAVSDATLVDLDDSQTLTNKVINFENNTAIVVYVVTESGGNFLIDGEANATISFRPGVVHRFDVSDSSVSSHPFVLSETSEGTAYTTGRTASGSQGSANAYIQFTVDADTPDNLFYYCSSHSGMGGKIGVFGSTLEGGSGLTITGNSIAVDATVITGQANEGAADNDDVILIYDDSASGLKKQTRSAFLTGTGVGNMNSFTISDGSTSETISDGNTITFSGTSNEVDVAVSATDTVTIGLPSSITANLTGNVTGNVSGTAGGLSATLAVASGGTGATSFADKSVIITQDSGTDTLAAVAMDGNGEILIGGTSGPAVGTLTAGTGVTITNADGSITIAAPDVGDITGVTAGTGLSGGGTSGAVTLNVEASQAITALTGGDLTIYEDANNADVSLKMGTSATESLTIEVLNGGSNKTAEQINFTTATASATANHGKMVFNVDETTVATIDDGGIDLASGLEFSVNGTAIGGSANALIVGDSDFTLTDTGTGTGIHYEIDNTDMADWNQAGVVLTTAGGIFQHHQTQAATYSVPSDTGAVLAGPITIQGTITNNGTMVVI